MSNPVGPETAANREVVCAAFEAWRTGTSAITDLFAPDMTWRMEGALARVEGIRQHAAVRR
jgi:ketosteroid isomerase-like protein